MDERHQGFVLVSRFDGVDKADVLFQDLEEMAGVAPSVFNHGRGY